MVDGGVEPGTGVVPATVQVLRPGGTSVAVNKPTQDIIKRYIIFHFHILMTKLFFVAP